MRMTVKRALLIGQQAYEPGDVIDVDEERSKSLLETGAAVLGVAEQATAPAPEQPADNPPVETAEARPAKETRSKK